MSDSSDPGFNVFKENTKYFIKVGINLELNSSEKDAFTIVYLSIRSLNKNLENLKTFLAKLSIGFHIICLTVSWYSENIKIFMKISMEYEVTIGCIKLQGIAKGGILSLSSRLFNL